MTTSNDSSMATDAMLLWSFKKGFIQPKTETNESCESINVKSISSIDTTSNLTQTSTNGVSHSPDVVTHSPDGVSHSLDIVSHSTEKPINCRTETAMENSCMSKNFISLSSDAAHSNQRKTAQDFLVLVRTFTSGEGTPFTNGYVYHAYLTLGKKSTKTSRQLLADLATRGHVSTDFSIRSALLRLVHRIETLKKSITKSWSNITSCLNEMFKVPQVKKKKPASVPVTIRDDSCVLPVNDENRERPKNTVYLDPEIQLKTDCEKCPATRRSYKTTIMELKSQIRASKLTIGEMSKRFSVQRLNQDMKRKAALREKLNEKYRALKRENLSLKKQMEHIKKVVEKDYGAIARCEQLKRMIAQRH